MRAGAIAVPPRGLRHVSPLVRNAPTPHGGVFDIELREPSYAFVFVLVGDRAVLGDSSRSLRLPSSDARSPCNRCSSMRWDHQAP